MEEKTLTRKEKFLFPLIREVRDKGLPLGEISFDEFFKYLFVSIEYIFGYSKNEIRSNNSTRDISDIRKMFCLISFDEKPSVVEIIGKELNKPKGSDIWRFFRKAEDLMEFDNLYKKNYTLLKSFFLSLFEFEVDEKKLFEKLSKTPLIEKRVSKKIKKDNQKKIIPAEKELRYIFSQEEKIVLKLKFITEIPFDHFAKIILNSVDYLFGYSAQIIQSKTRQTDIVNIRRMMVTLLYEFYNKDKITDKTSRAKIGKVINKDHASVFHQCGKHNLIIKKDKLYQENFDKLINFLDSLFKEN